MNCPTCGSQFIMRHLSTGDSQCMACNYKWNDNVAPPLVLTREIMERREWDTVQKIQESYNELHQLMMYFLLNRQGMRMEGIEKKIETALATKWKEGEAK